MVAPIRSSTQIMLESIVTQDLPPNFPDYQKPSIAKFQNASCYYGLNRSKKSSAQLREGNTKVGSVDLIDKQHVITAAHCFYNMIKVNGKWRGDPNTSFIDAARNAKNMSVTFGYQCKACGDNYFSANTQGKATYKITGLIEYQQNGLDYAIVKLDGNAGEHHPIAKIALKKMQGESVFLVQYPGGLPQQIDNGHLWCSEQGHCNTTNIDTLGGSSGGGYRDKKEYHVAVHHSGSKDANFSTSNIAIYLASRFMRELLQNEFKQAEPSEFQIYAKNIALFALVFALVATMINFIKQKVEGKEVSLSSLFGNKTFVGLTVIGAAAGGYKGRREVQEQRQIVEKANQPREIERRMHEADPQRFSALRA